MTPIAWLAFLNNELVIAGDARELVIHFEAERSDVFVAWLVNYPTSNLERYLVRRSGEAWDFIDEAGRATRSTGEPPTLYEWLCSSVARHQPPVGTAVALEDWHALHPPTEQPGYTPFGFSLPQRGETGLVYDWCPELVCQQIEHLPEPERMLYVEAMMSRLTQHTLALVKGSTMPLEQFEHALDERLRAEFPRALNVMTDVHLAALDRMHGG